jgi:AraC-like DNA-binding protein
LLNVDTIFAMKRQFNDRPQNPHLLKISTPVQTSFVVKDDQIAWNNPWHFHPEIELLYCIKGKGMNYIGNYVHAIEEGEILLFGSNLPHTRQRLRSFYQENPVEVPETIVIQFHENFLGEDFFKLKEFLPISHLLAKSRRGLKFTGRTKQDVAEKLVHLRNLSGAAAIIELLGILTLLARCDEFVFLNPARYLNDLKDRDSEKINKVYGYTLEHFTEHISLATVAGLTNLSAAAFCRYFKARTRKSYVEYLTETRIDYACELLMQGNLDVTHVCYASGFNNLSNFHKQFKKIMKVTPTSYRLQALEKVHPREGQGVCFNPG